MSPSPFPQILLTLTTLREAALHRPYILTTLTASVLGLATYLTRSYRGWLALGRGGLPHNVFGYFINVSLHLLARTDLRSPAPYALEGLEETYGHHAFLSFFNSKTSPPLPPNRTPPRPTVPSYIAPQRQTSARARPEMIARMQAFLESLVAANPDLLSIRPSGLEGPLYNAVWLKNTHSSSSSKSSTTRPKAIDTTKGEIIHVHSEGSSHMVLSLADATTAIQSFWAERHALSGGALLAGRPLLPWGYVLVYAPRDEGEFEVWKGFVAASARFMTTAAAAAGAGAGAGGSREVVIPA
ncbi:hypothetical protein F5Y17DRAFT_448764 [Xylariaceae sp. FL0594]|nr:hypothetical protein F5Y17DRAFT_448764 [Xylariaceae sp. FL0594]